MEDQLVSFTACPSPSRWIYLKTALVIFVAAEMMNFFAQVQLVQRLELKYSSIACAVVSLMVVALLLGNPLTRSLSINYGERTVIVDFSTLFSSNRTLTIPFNRLGILTDQNEDALTSKWKSWLLLDEEKVYLLLSSETGFTLEQTNEFVARLLKITGDQSA